MASCLGQPISWVMANMLRDFVVVVVVIVHWHPRAILPAMLTLIQAIHWFL